MRSENRMKTEPCRCFNDQTRWVEQKTKSGRIITLCEHGRYIASTPILDTEAKRRQWYNKRPAKKEMSE